jgi:outer membrane protein insertion porin family
LTQRADGSGKQTLSYSTRLGFSGDETPLFENFFAGGYATLRGFEFRGASPVGVSGVEVGGEFQWLNSLEYMFPITADDAFRGVAFVDFGTVEKSVKIDADTFRVSPGLGLRVAIPMLGPAPLAFDFAYPVAKADTDQTRVFSFYMSLIR